MAKQVSRSGDNGQSTAVPVNDLGGHFEDHKADAADLSSGRAALVPPTFKGMQDIATSGWIENLTNAINYLKETNLQFLTPGVMLTLGILSIYGSKVDICAFDPSIDGHETVLEYYESDHKPILFDFSHRSYIKKSGGSQTCINIPYCLCISLVIIAVMVIIFCMICFNWNYYIQYFNYQFRNNGYSNSYQEQSISQGCAQYLTKC